MKKLLLLLVIAVLTGSVAQAQSGETLIKNATVSSTPMRVFG